MLFKDQCFILGSSSSPYLEHQACLMAFNDFGFDRDIRVGEKIRWDVDLPSVLSADAGSTTGDEENRDKKDWRESCLEHGPPK